MDCLKKAIKIADKCMNEVKNIYLFINILNKYLYYYSIDAEFVSTSKFYALMQITTEDINNLIELIKEHIDQSQGDDQQMKDALKYLKNTKEAMKARTLGDQAQKYKDLKLAII